jgi:2-methylcitrate dehydratase PrpD
VKPIADESLRRDEAYASVMIGDRRLDVHVEHASGTVDNPLSDDAIESKFLANATPVIGAERAARAGELTWALDKQPDVRALLALLA